jgi:hypothetical protein
MRNPFRRPEPAPEPGPAPEPPLPPGLEREIAIGSLSGIAPTDVRAHLLIVIDADGGLKMTGVACPEMAMVMLTQAAASIAQDIARGHAHEAPGGE